MTVLVAIITLFVISLILLILNRFNIRTGYLWFLALGGALLSWILVLVARTQSPIQIILVQWEPAAFFLSTPKLLIDELSWIFATVILVFPISVFLTDVIQGDEIDAGAWATSLAMTGLSLLAIFAANPLTLVLAWVFMDFSETLILLQRVSTSEQRERVVVSFSVRLLGVFLVIIANLIVISQNAILDFESIPKDVSVLLLLAVGMRLGVIPPHQPFFQEPPLRKGLGTIIRLSPIVSSLVILSRLAYVGVSMLWRPVFLFAAILGALYGGFAWAQAKNELDGRPYWILGFSSFVLVATLYMLPDASVAWGIGMLLSGSVLFLNSYRNRFISILLILGVLGVSLFPFTPSWMGSAIHSQTGAFVTIVLIISHALLLVGYVRHSQNIPKVASDKEPWMVLVYPLGLVLLLLTQWSQSLALGNFQFPEASFPLGWLVGFIGLILAAGIIFTNSRGIKLPVRITSFLDSVLSFKWMYGFFWWLYRSLGRLFSSISNILEGEGGVLWTILILILLIILVSQVGTGG